VNRDPAADRPDDGRGDPYAGIPPVPVAGNSGDPYREWDAAYVMGSLDPADRHAFEHHLLSCRECSAAVAQLAGLPGILAALPASEVEFLAGNEDRGESPPPTVLTGLAAKIRRRRLRNAALAAGIALGSAAAASGITLAVTAQPAVLPSAVQPATTLVLHFNGSPDSSVVADGTVQNVGWGTRIDWTCSYHTAGVSYQDQTQPPKRYLLVVTDLAGVETVAASWEGSPDSVVAPTATISTPINQLRSIDIRWAGNGRTALRAELPPTAG
jgi:RNA polymerase sigma-70 factor (ECF subfamily)